MKTIVNKSLWLLLMLCMTATFGCDTVDPEPETAPPVIPETAFALDINLFDQADQAGKNNAAITHFINAALRVGVAQHVAGTILFFPVTLTHALQVIEPEFDNGSFVWAVETTVEGRRHGVELRARQQNNTVNWQMRVSGTIGHSGLVFEDFLLYEANTDLEANEGNFQVFAPVENGSLHVLDGDYNVVDESEYTLSFQVPQGVDNIGGSEATFSKNEDLHILDLTGGDGLSHYMEWNQSTRAGSITADNYNNGQTACWDNTLANVACEAS